MNKYHRPYSSSLLCLLFIFFGGLSMVGCAPAPDFDSDYEYDMEFPEPIGGSTSTKQSWRFRTRATAYYPHNSRLEGGFKDRRGFPLHTLQQYLAGKAPYVSVAMDLRAFPYGTKIRIPEFEKHYGRRIEFRVVDTGGAFKGRGTSRIDVCVASKKHTYHPLVNSWLTLLPHK